MTITLNGTTGITTPALDSVAPFSSADMPAGSVIQVVHGILDYPVVFSANTWTDIGLSATITPTSTTSKILVIVHIQVGGDSSSYDAGIALARNGTHIGKAPNSENRNACFMPFNSRSQTPYETASISNSLLDAPASISALTYKLQGLAYNSTNQFINRCSSDGNNGGDSRHISNITLMEISG